MPAPACWSAANACPYLDLDRTTWLKNFMHVIWKCLMLIFLIANIHASASCLQAASILCIKSRFCILLAPSLHFLGPSIRLCKNGCPEACKFKYNVLQKYNMFSDYYPPFSDQQPRAISLPLQHVASKQIFCGQELLLLASIIKSCMTVRPLEPVGICLALPLQGKDIASG